MTSSLANKSILITGANGGIGRATCQRLLVHKPKQLTMACRTARQALECEQRLANFSHVDTELTGVGGFEMLDAGHLKQAVTQLKPTEKYDVVFIQVGGVFFDKEFRFIPTKNSQIERTIFQNAIGGYLLLQYLIEADLLARNARIVFAGGEGARGVKPIIDKFTFHRVEDLLAYMRLGHKQPYHTMNAIGISKLVSALISLKLADLDTTRQYVWFSPGLTGGTYGLDHKPGMGRYLSKYLIFPVVTWLGLAQSPSQAAEKCVRVLTGELGQSGDLIGAPEGKVLGKLCDQKPMNPDFTNKLLRDQLFDYLQKEFGLWHKS